LAAAPTSGATAAAPLFAALSIATIRSMQARHGSEAQHCGEAQHVGKAQYRVGEALAAAPTSGTTTATPLLAALSTATIRSMQAPHGSVAPHSGEAQHTPVAVQNTPSSGATAATPLLAALSLAKIRSTNATLVPYSSSASYAS
jgi:hypothetical protein